MIGTDGREPTDAKHKMVLEELVECCQGWVAGVRILGNVRADEAKAALLWALSGDRLAPAAEAATGEPTDTHVIRCESGDEITVPDWNAAQARVLAGPGEPTDAGLLRNLWKQWMDGDANEYRDAMRGARVRGREYLSGTRPMPNHAEVQAPAYTGEERRRHVHRPCSAGGMEWQYDRRAK